MAVLINDLFDFFWLYTVPGNVFDIVVVPLRLQLPESHRLKLPQKTASFDSSNAKLSRRAFIQPSSERQNPKESKRTLLSWKQVRCRRIYSKISAPAGTQSRTVPGWGKHSLEIQRCPVFCHPAKGRTRSEESPCALTPKLSRRF